MNKRHGFTLIEMLVVIAIMGIVAAMVVNMNGAAQVKKRQAQVEGDKQKLMLMISSYQSKMNFYPPDNGNLASLSVGTPAAFAFYDATASTNPLLYELTGATNLTNGNIQFFDGTSNTLQTTFNGLFGRLSVANSNPDEPHNFFTPQAKEYTNYVTNTPYNNLEGLLVPVPLTNGNANFWHYDSSSPNRHNLSSYDLWAEYVSGTKGGSNIITTNGNW